MTETKILPLPSGNQILNLRELTDPPSAQSSFSKNVQNRDQLNNFISKYDKLAELKQSFKPKQSTSNLINSNKQYYEKAIKFIQNEHETTLSKLHVEVAKLKCENKRLNFQILIDQEDTNDIVKESLGNLNLNKSKISSEILLKETIKDLKCKLKLSQDTQLHLNNTIKNLNKKITTLKIQPQSLPKSTQPVPKVYLPNPPDSGRGDLTIGDKRMENLSSRFRKSNRLGNKNDEKTFLINRLLEQNKLKSSKIEELTKIIEKSKPQLKTDIVQEQSTLNNVSKNSSFQNISNKTILNDPINVLNEPIVSKLYTSAKLPPINLGNNNINSNIDNNLGVNGINPKSSNSSLRSSINYNSEVNSIDTCRSEKHWQSEANSSPKKCKNLNTQNQRNSRVDINQRNRRRIQHNKNKNTF